MYTRFSSLINPQGLMYTVITLTSCKCGYTEAVMYQYKHKQAPTDDLISTRLSNCCMQCF